MMECLQTDTPEVQARTSRRTIRFGPVKNNSNQSVSLVAPRMKLKTRIDDRFSHFLILRNF